MVVLAEYLVMIFELIRCILIPGMDGNSRSGHEEVGSHIEHRPCAVDIFGQNAPKNSVSPLALSALADAW